ncbi:hypothetical protein [Agromyces subbeticus]|uniref:hypothetical protein n=1 Tax=Agromyces subbeticus TaxID=293890 RepID=UPI0003B3F606|nr:hypothetical protein [Agromyces subbeticus]
MYIAESSFPHLVAANDERLATALERRRVATERRLESAAATTRRPRRATARWGTRHQVVDPVDAACCATA